MEKIDVTVPWKHGLHMLPASRLARLAKGFRATLRVTLGSRAADAASVLSLLILGATAGATLQVEAFGDDEKEALTAVVEFFADGASAEVETLAEQE